MISRRRAPVVPQPVVPAWSPEMAVALGAGLFDRRKEHWRKRLAGLPLRVASVRECPLARLYGSYQAGAAELGLSRAEAVAHGFIWPPGQWNNDGLRAALDEAWAAQLAGGQS